MLNKFSEQKINPTNNEQQGIKIIQLKTLKIFSNILKIKFNKPFNYVVSFISN